MICLYCNWSTINVLVKTCAPVNYAEQLFLYLSTISLVLVSALDVNATGWPSCNTTAPSPDSDASHCRVTSLLGSKYFNTGSLVINCFPCFHDFSYVSLQCQCHCTSLSNRRLSGSVTSDRLGRKFARYVIIPSSRCRAFLSEGVGIATIALPLLGSGLRPSGVRHDQCRDSTWMFFSRHLARSVIRSLSWTLTAL